MNPKSNPVNWFEIYVSDMPRAKAFYESTFEVELNQLESPAIELWAFPMDQEKYGCSGALARMEGIEPGGASTIVYFHCDDCAVEAHRAVENGGKLIKDKMPIGEYGYIALLIDTEGNKIGLHSMQ